MSKLVSLRQLNARSFNVLLKNSPKHLSFASTTLPSYQKIEEKKNISIISKRFLHSSRLRLNAQDSEKVVGNPEKYEFLAETKQLLNIVAKSLYSDKEVFIRELISNASDAIEKLKYAQLTSNVPADTQIPFEIQINANDLNNTLTIQVELYFKIL